MPVVAAVALVVPRLVHACSPALDVDREAFYRALARPAYGIWSVSILAALIWVIALLRQPAATRRTWVPGALLILMAALQPAWWMDSMRGDCGRARDGSALVVAALSLVILGLWLRFFRVSSEPDTTTN